MDEHHSIDYQRRFGGLARLYGASGADKIAAAHVAVIGVGGVGSWVVEALARSGVNELTLIDLDNVAESNINRQVQAETRTIGQPKVFALSERIAQINPLCKVHCIEDFVDENNVARLLGMAHFSAVVDACDQVRAKAALINACRLQHLPVVTVGAAGGKQFAEKLEIDDIGLATHDPLLAQLRYRLKKNYGFTQAKNKKIGVVAVFSRESVKKADTMCDLPQTSSDLSCSGYGSSVVVTASFGMVAAGWVVQKILKS